MIPKWVAGLLSGEEVFINGDGETSRDFCYIDNAVQANILAAMTDSNEALSQVFNVAVHERTTLNQLFNMIRESLAEHIPEVIDRQPAYRDFRSGDVRHSLADISKAEALLGYSPTHRVGQGLKEAMEWYVEDIVRSGAGAT